MAIGQLGVVLCILQTATVTSIVLCWTYSGEILLPLEAEALVAGVGAISGGRTTPAAIITTPLSLRGSFQNLPATSFRVAFSWPSSFGASSAELCLTSFSVAFSWPAKLTL